MTRTAPIWLAFALGVALVLAAMAWVSAAAVRSDHAERQANRQAAIEEKIRLALWRMDSALVPLLVRESARAAFVYRVFHPLGNAYSRLFRQLRTEEILVASPLLGFESEEVLVHFQLEGDGTLTSPQVPRGNDLDVATDGHVTGERVDRYARRLADLAKVLDQGKLLAALPAPAEPPASEPAPGARRELPDISAQRTTRQRTRAEETRYLNTINAAARQAARDQAQFAKRVVFHPAVAPAAANEGELRPCWIGDALLLARRVRIDGREVIQGCRLHWKNIRAELLRAADDLLPAASLVAASANDTGNGHVLATLPVRLLPGAVPEDVAPGPSAVPTSLLIAWACMLTGAAAVAVLLAKAVSLSRRRGAFVSAVTHELRTPLTTFRLYSEMLAEGMVPDETKRQDYLRRLRDEADRLSHLVENVLVYARLAGPRSTAHLESVPMGEIVRRSRERLSALAERAGMVLDLDVDERTRQMPIRCNASAVEQVLLNLVDNACKYAGRASDRRIHVQASCRASLASLVIRDHGPGIAPAERKGLFKPFRKSAHQAANSAPGIGLGLALSRRLARTMGGDLRYRPGDEPGACFVMTVPVETP